MIKVIIVPTDGSDHAEKAVGLAADIANKYSARLVILHVLMRHESSSEMRAICEKHGSPKELIGELDAHDDSVIEVATSTSVGGYGPIALPVSDSVVTGVAEMITAKAKENASNKGVTDIDVKIIDGPATDMILAAAEDEHADMIVMGSRGLGKFSGLLMGSVSHKVSHLSPCTCVTVK